MRNKLWGTCRAGNKTVRIYTSSRLKAQGDLGETSYWVGEDPVIVMAVELLEDPARFDRILLHEFIHVIEYVAARNLAKSNPENCTRYAMAIEKYLPGMLTSLRQKHTARSVPDKSSGKLARKAGKRSSSR